MAHSTSYIYPRSTVMEQGLVHQALPAHISQETSEVKATQGGFRVDIRKNFFPVRVVRSEHKLLRKAVATSSLEVLWANLDRALSNFFLWKGSGMRGVLRSLPPQIILGFDDSLILRTT